MKLRMIPAGMFRTNAYLLTDPESGQALLIDAPGGIWEIIAPVLEAERCTLGALWLTHGHFDHMEGGAEVVARSGAKVLAHRDDQVLIETPEVMKKFLGEEIELHPVKVDQWIAPGDRLAVFGQEVEVRHVPGHCPGNVLFYFASVGAAFVGDALFAGSIGRTDFEGGSLPLLEKSIREQIYTLPPETVVYPGHGRATTVGEEMQSNLYVRA